MQMILVFLAKKRGQIDKKIEFESQFSISLLTNLRQIEFLVANDLHLQNFKISS